MMGGPCKGQLSCVPFVSRVGSGSGEGSRAHAGEQELRRTWEIARVDVRPCKRHFRSSR